MRTQCVRIDFTLRIYNPYPKPTATHVQLQVVQVLALDAHAIHAVLAVQELQGHRQRDTCGQSVAQRMQAGCGHLHARRARPVSMQAPHFDSRGGLGGSGLASISMRPAFYSKMEATRIKIKVKPNPPSPPQPPQASPSVPPA